MAAKQARDIEKEKKRAAKRARNAIKNQAKNSIVKDEFLKKAMAHLEQEMKKQKEDEERIALGLEIVPETVLTREENDKLKKEEKK